MRIAILGGTFNPVHNGHIHLAKEAAKKLCLNKVIFTPTYIPPHKLVRRPVPPGDRLKMLRLAVSKSKKFEISQYELEKKGRSYSINTARAFKRKCPKDSELFFLIGADSLSGLRKWKDIAKLRKIIKFVAAPRKGSSKKPPYKDIVIIDVPKRNVSSTEIRRRLHSDRSIKGLVPKTVEMYIKRRKLYRNA
ncbi:MAG: nicotinate-nucleotide adenylyltransferase [Candidatus Omnitrophota bacterium]